MFATCFQIAVSFARNRRVEQRNAPIANIDHRLQKTALHGRFTHLRNLIVVAGDPAAKGCQRRGQCAKALISLDTAVLGQITSGQQAVNMRLLGLHQINHLLQALRGLEPQQRAIRFCKQVAVRELHQQHRVFGGQRGYIRQGGSPGEGQ